RSRVRRRGNRARCDRVAAGGVMRSARWEWALVACAIAACQVDANSAVQVDANSAVQRSELSSDTCRPALLRRCEATNCGHRCADDATAPPGHLINFFDCTSSGATSCSATFTTCDPTTGLDDPPPAPIVFDCGDDHCRGPAPPVTCRPSGCVADCDADLQSRIPVGWRITAANCDASSESSCAESMTVCEVATGTIVPLSTALSCPACPPQPQVPC